MQLLGQVELHGFEEAARNVLADSLEKAVTDAFAELRSRVAEQFITQGAAYSAPWAARKEKRPSARPLLISTGRLIGSLVNQQHRNTSSKSSPEKEQPLSDSSERPSRTPTRCTSERARRQPVPSSQQLCSLGELIRASADLHEAIAEVLENAQTSAETRLRLALKLRAFAASIRVTADATD